MNKSIRGRITKPALLWAAILGSVWAGVPAPAGADEVAGTATAVNTRTTGFPPSATERSVNLGDDVFRKERLVTDAGGTAQLLFPDRSTITIASDSEVVIDDYLFESTRGTGRLQLEMTRGILRFVGGKLSKQNTVQVRTPTATIGIRGGIVFVEVEPLTGSTTAVLGFGTMTIQAGGVIREVLKPDFGATVRTAGEAPGSVERQPDGFMARVLSAVEGSPTLAGEVLTGIGDLARVPQDLIGLNSAQQPATTAPAAGDASEAASEATATADTLTDPVTIAEQAQAEADEARTEDEAIEDLANLQPPPPRPEVPAPVTEPPTATPGDGGGSGPSGPTTNPDQPPTQPPPSPIVQTGRLLRAGSTYVTGFATTVTDPGTVGLLGGSTGLDEVVVIRKPSADRLDVTAAAGSLSLPLGAGTRLSLANVASPWGPLEGVYSAGADGAWYKYDLKVTGQAGQTLMLAGGTAAPAAALQTRGAVRSYRLEADPARAGDVGIATTLMPGAERGAFTSPFHLIESPAGGRLGTAGADRASLGLVGTLYLENGRFGGAGGLAVTAGSWLDAAGTTQAIFAGSRRGSVLPGGAGGQITLGGGVASLALAADGGSFVGPNAEAFVLGYDVARMDALAQEFERAAERPASGTLTGAAHLAVQTGTRTTASLKRDLTSIQGYSAGLAGYPDRPVDALPTIFRSGSGSSSELAGLTYATGGPTGLVLNFDAATNRVGGVILARDARNERPVSTYGLGLGHLDNKGDGVFVDDATYGAANNNARTSIRLDDGTNAFLRPNAETYLVGNELVEAVRFFPSNVTACVCEFMEWGFWGGGIDYSYIDGTTGLAAQSTDLFHMGGWVGGVVPTLAEIPETGSASFAGHVYGEYAERVAAQVRRGVDVGNLAMNWNFASRSGNVAISEFAGRSFAGNLAASPSNGRDFQGSIGGTAGTSGVARGSFFKGPVSPVQGVGGDWYVNGSDFRAAGIFVGQQPAGTN